MTEQDTPTTAVDILCMELEQTVDYISHADANVASLEVEMSAALAHAAALRQQQQDLQAAVRLLTEAQA